MTWTAVQRRAGRAHRGATPTTRTGAWVGVETRALVRPHPARGRQLHDRLGGDRRAEAPKLEAAYAKLDEVLAKDRAHGRMHPGITLYIAGHTDTVGSAGQQPQAVAGRAPARSPAWFRKRGVRLPDLVRGLRRDVA